MGAFKVGIELGVAAWVLFSLQMGCAGDGSDKRSQEGSGAGRAGAQSGSAQGGDSAQGGLAQGGSAGTGDMPQGGDAHHGGESNEGGGGAHPSPTGPLQLNDVSLLFPLPGADDTLASGLLAASAQGEHGQLLPKSLYEGVGPIAGSSGGGVPGAQLTAAYQDLRIVGLRIDPCFASLAPPSDGAGCQNQLRLVAQEVVAGEAADSALHLFYSVSRDELLELARGVALLREQYAAGKRLGKLAPHPIMVEQGLAGGMAAGVRQLVLAHAGAQNLTRITRLSARGGPFWDFSGFDVKDGAVVSFPIPTLEGEVAQRFERNFGSIETEQPKVVPASGSADDFTRLLTVSTAQGLSAGERTNLLTSLLRVENPGHHSPDTIDCVTCHLATPTVKLVVEPILKTELPDVPERFRSDPEVVPASELEPTFEDREPLTNVHAFSYTGRSVGINQRTVNESAAVVAYLSRRAEP